MYSACGGGHSLDQVRRARGAAQEPRKEALSTPNGNARLPARRKRSHGLLGCIAVGVCWGPSGCAPNCSPPACPPPAVRGLTPGRGQRRRSRLVTDRRPLAPPGERRRQGAYRRSRVMAAGVRPPAKTSPSTGATPGQVTLALYRQGSAAMDAVGPRGSSRPYGAARVPPAAP
jgi:hypothetical protein